MEHLRLSDGEWKLMKTLWQRQPRTLAELVAALDAETGWSRATIFMMIRARSRWTTAEDFSNTAPRSRIQMLNPRKRKHFCRRFTEEAWA